MPLNEATRKPRERWPLKFDLEGVPQQTAERTRRLELEQQQQFSETEEPMNNVPLVQNSFAVDYQAGNNVVDINNPPQKRYVHQEFPKLVYHHESGHTLKVDDDKQLKLALKKGYDLKPDLTRDYSKMGRNQIAPVKAEPARPPVTEEELLAADEAENG